MSFLDARTRSRQERRQARTSSGRSTSRSPAPDVTRTTSPCGQTYASMVRSPHAHARIVRIDTAAPWRPRACSPLLTGADLVADGSRRCRIDRCQRSPRSAAQESRRLAVLSSRIPCPCPSIASASSASPSRWRRRDGARCARRRRAGHRRVGAAAGGRPRQRTPSRLTPSPCGTRARRMSRSRPRPAMPPRRHRVSRRAAHVVTLDTRINRVTGVPMEPRAAVGDFDASTGRYTVYADQAILANSQRLSSRPRRAAGIRSRHRARSWRSYGTRNPCYPEYPLSVGGRRVRRPV